jgi:hypothetical protein
MVREFLTSQFGLYGDSPFRAHDIEQAALALLAVAVFWYLDRKRPGLNADRGTFGYVVIWVQYFFGIHALESGLNFFINPEAQPIMEQANAAAFQFHMTEMGLFTVVKVIEVVVGLCLVLNVFVPLAAMLEMPVSIIICYMAVFVVAGPRQLWTGPKELICNALLLFAHWGYFRGLFSPHIRWKPVWKNWGEVK